MEAPSTISSLCCSFTTSLTLHIIMKLLILFACVVYAVADAGPECLNTKEAADCYRNFTSCRKLTNSHHARSKCLKTFDTCVAGPCPVACNKVARDCLHKTGNLAPDLIQCRVDHEACMKTCVDKLFE
ncbi:uncharacterized protein LOC130625631 [Hydractinia symbiolongicarpus]|uniref:uncharacterized protein LOC130625631 n=1 Tax=Hydractinia symbiolongicarpus TaxID=13093 RepID=UPI00254A8E9E|nr:uncharacterized protein LOC130625631 [Hydractinia symbiolongicarpus]